MIEVRFHPDARDELDAAFDWYLERNPVAARSFLRQIDGAIERIARNPEAWPEHLAGTRRFIVRLFPFQVVYLGSTTSIEVVAVAHDRRRPGYWRNRVSAI